MSTSISLCSHSAPSQLYFLRTGIDFSVLTPLVRPSSKEAHAELDTDDAAAASSVSTNNPTNNPSFPEECTNSDSSYPAEPTNRSSRPLRQANARACSVSSGTGKVVGGGEGGTSAGNSKGNSRQKAGGRSSSTRTPGTSRDQANSDRKYPRRGVTHVQHKGDLSSVGEASDPTGATFGSANASATVRETSGQDGEPLEENMTQHDGNGLMASPRLASLDVSTLSKRGGIAAFFGCSHEDMTNKLKVRQNHSAIPASASQMFSLRTRCAVESKEASRARRRLFVSLGVGKHHTPPPRSGKGHLSPGRPVSPWHQVTP